MLSTLVVKQGTYYICLNRVPGRMRWGHSNLNVRAGLWDGLVMLVDLVNGVLSYMEGVGSHNISYWFLGYTYRLGYFRLSEYNPWILLWY